MTICPYPSTENLVAEASAIKLPRYAAIIGYRECPFFGVNQPGTVNYACRTIWTKPQRDMVIKYLAEAQEEIEAQTGYPLMPRWFTDEVQSYKFPLHTKWSKVIAAGVRAESDIDLGAAVNHAADPATVIVATTLTVDQLDEVHIYHPGTDIEIWPSCLTLAAGVLTISIPRCRLVTEAASDNDEQGLDYSDTAPAGPFEQTVDVKRAYNDTTTQAVMVWPHANGSCSCGNLSCPSCSEYTKSACMYVRKPEIGTIDVLPATYSGGSWSVTYGCNSRPKLVRLNYYAGLETLTRQAEDAIVRLAHAKMPEEPCGCQEAIRMWRRDRNIPEILSRERLNCIFGLNDGAWIAFRFAKAMTAYRGSVL